MKRMIFAMASIIALMGVCGQAQASFIPRGVIANLNNGNLPTCGQTTQWYNNKHRSSKDRRILGYWILGFFTGIEFQMIKEPDFATATGVEMQSSQILNMVEAFCKDQPKSGLLDSLVSFVRYGLTESVKHPHPGYSHGPNIHGQIVSSMTCQNLTLQTTGTISLDNGNEYKDPRVDQEQKFMLEEWMLGTASGIEAMALNNNPIQGTPESNEALLAQFYKTCQDNPTWMVVQAVLDQELSNIQAVKQAARL